MALVAFMLEAAPQPLDRDAADSAALAMHPRLGHVHRAVRQLS
jgi:hypothetical protein